MAKKARLISRKMLSTDERLIYESRPSAVKYMVSATIVILIGLGALALYLFQYLEDPPSVPYLQDYLDGEYGDYIYIALLAVFGLCALYFIVKWLRWGSTVFAVTDERIITQRGILNKSYEDVPLGLVASVDISQSIAKRMLGYGTIAISSQASSRGRATIVWEAVPDPLAVRRRIQDVLDTRAKREG